MQNSVSVNRRKIFTFSQCIIVNFSTGNSHVYKRHRSVYSDSTTQLDVELSCCAINGTLYVIRSWEFK